MILLALALQATAAPALPDAAQIAEADFQQAAARCIDLYHAAPCPTDRFRVTAVACRSDGDGARCGWEQRAPGLPGSETCDAAFVRRDGRWLYGAKPGAPNLPPSEAVQLPRCTATGSPGSAALAAARLAAAPRLSCVLFPTDRWTCPAANKPVEDVRCTRWSTRHPFDCHYTVVSEGRRHACHALLTNAAAGWTIATMRASDRRIVADESCQ